MACCNLLPATDWPLMSHLALQVDIPWSWQELSWRYCMYTLYLPLASVSPSLPVPSFLPPCLFLSSFSHFFISFLFILLFASFQVATIHFNHFYHNLKEICREDIYQTDLKTITLMDDIFSQNTHNITEVQGVHMHAKWK